MNKILLGDSQEILKTIGERTVHLTCTSPPYYNARSYSIWPTYAEYLQFLTNVFEQVLRVTQPGRMCCVNLSPVIEARKSRAHESKRLAIPFHFFSLMEKMGWKYIDDIVWVKPEGSAINRNGGFYQHRKPVAYKPNIVSETIFVFQKPADFLIDKVVRSYKDEVLEESLVKEDYERSNVSYVGDVVLDPFMGSGTTAISCIDFKRNYIGCEIHQEYVTMAENRIKLFSPLNKFFI